MPNDKLQEAVDRLLEAVRESRQAKQSAAGGGKGGEEKNENTQNKELVDGLQRYTQHRTAKEEDEQC